VNERQRPSLLIVQPNSPSASETFLQAHADHLPARVRVMSGAPPAIDGRPLRSQALVWRAWRKALRVLRGQGWEAEATAAFLEAFRRHRPAAVLAEYGESGVAVLSACRRADVPLVVHFHGYDASLHECLRRMAGPYREMFRDAAAVIAVSQPMREQLIALGAPPEKVHWSPYGVDCTRFGGAAPEVAGPVFLAVGRLVEKKGPRWTLEAFAGVRRACPQARLRVIGDGPLREACRRRAAELEIAAAVDFLGACPPPVVQEEMRRARCFVQHSVEAPDGDREGMPVSVLEAGASGLPVVATRHAGIPEVVVEGQTGFLVEERDAAGMAGHMLRLAQDPELAGRLGRAARERVAADFSLPRSIDRLWGIIEQAIRLPSSSRAVACVR
jgi:glycosyltransferase involved in cell wall biosynthesis